ncbi:MAG: haloacid dehalogenase [Deltaproteobacteria bacterium]|nr:haloacid dehalogenase [Deltaproteobacteria bacterium]MBW2020440.1 haloacid dehalogenase [Deltaproteobacteria bacterium]MBW2075184.1 haloacid dehalogenase [Deltaproteobacteria bacterium]RLB81376.1 MAG: haloacid dehalogenase [Deltaproteobacteria bacterium]
MITPGHIAFDIDGVFANTMALFLEIARRDYGINHIRYEDITEYFLEECLDIDPEIIRVIINRILEGDFETELKPIDGAVEVLAEFAEAQPLLFVTARPQLSPIKEWVHRMLPLKPFGIEVIATGTFEGKADVLDARGIQYFVEDCLETCFMLSEHAITPILFRQPWNRSSPHPFREVGSWAEIRALVNLHSS